jgi:hypothetical protein
VEEHICLCLLGCHHHPLPQQPELHSLRLRYYYYAVGDEVPLGAWPLRPHLVARTLLRQLAQELLKSALIFTSRAFAYIQLCIAPLTSYFCF